MLTCDSLREKLAWVGFFFLGAVCLKGDILPHDVNAPQAHVGIYQSSTSPSHQFVALSGIGMADVSPSLRMRLRVIIIELTTVRVQQITPWLTGEWAVAWAPNDILLICGQNDETNECKIVAYELRSGMDAKDRQATVEEKNIIMDAFTKKYGHQPQPVHRFDPK